MNHTNLLQLFLLLCLAMGTTASCAQEPQLVGVREITLSPTNVELPSVHWQLDHRSFIVEDKRYVIRKDGDQFHLYFVQNGKYEKVIGDMPTLTSSYMDQKRNLQDRDFHGFTTVASSSYATTYAEYTKFEAAWIDGMKLAPSDLYTLGGNRIHKILSNIEPAGINSLGIRSSLSGYVDQNGNLYVLTRDGMLYVIRDAQIVAKANVRNIGAMRPAIPSMFSDGINVYFLVPKLFNSKNSRTGYGPVSESQIKAKYKINF